MTRTIKLLTVLILGSLLLAGCAMNGNMDDGDGNGDQSMDRDGGYGGGGGGGGGY